MINNPQNFFDQVRNLCEELGLKMKAISESIASMLSKSDAESTYLKKTDAQSTYLGKTAKAESAKTADTATTATSATKATQDGNGAVISSTYLKSATASSTYLTKSDAATTYLGKDAKAQSATFADSATTATNATSALRATQDADGNVISGTYLKNANAESTYLKKSDASSTYLTKSDASSAYLGKTAKAASASTADSATKATQDGSGNNIEATYAKKSEIPEVDTSSLVKKAGDRGLLAGYEQSVIADDYYNSDDLEITKDMPDSVLWAGNGHLSVYSSEYEATWTKVVYCTKAPDSVYISGMWMWANTSLPTFSDMGGIFVFHWSGRGGVASYSPLYESDIDLS